LVWIPKYRRKEPYIELWKYLGSWFRDLAFQKESQIIEGYLKPDYVQMLISIPPKYSVAQVVGFLKGKSAIQIAQVYLGKRKNFTRQHFWARGYFVYIVGINAIRLERFIVFYTSTSGGGHDLKVSGILYNIIAVQIREKG
jgi:putative transposase